MTHVSDAFCDKNCDNKAKTDADKDIEIADLKTNIDKLKTELAEAKAQHQTELAKAKAQHQTELAKAKAQHQTINKMLIDTIIKLKQKILSEFNNHQIQLENLRAHYRA